MNLFLKYRLIFYLLFFLFSTLIFLSFISFFYYLVATEKSRLELIASKAHVALTDSGEACIDNIRDNIVFLDNRELNLSEINCHNYNKPYKLGINEGWYERILPDFKKNDYNILPFQLIYEYKENKYVFLSSKHNLKKSHTFWLSGKPWALSSHSDNDGDNHHFLFYARYPVADFLSDKVLILFLLILSSLIFIIIIYYMHFIYIKFVETLSELSFHINEKIMAIDEKVITKRTTGDLSFINTSFNKLFNLTIENQKKLEQELIRKSDFNKILGHEIKSPLQSLKFMLKENDEGIRKINRIVKTLENIEQASKQEDMFDSGEKYDIDIKSFLSEYINNQNHFIRDINLEIDNSYHGLFVYTDPEALEQILDHLINNANEHRYIDTSINVILKYHHHHCIISIYNNGDNIDKESLNKIFDLGYSTKQKDENRGQGLYASKLIAQKMGVYITANNVEHGVRFDVKIILVSN